MPRSQEPTAVPLGIRPTVDFAFKKIFGSPQNSQALIGLLNAVLDRECPIDSVELLNPFNYQEFAESKPIVLDVRCLDSAGHWLNVEMQVSVYNGLLERLVYYACTMYADQIEIGQNYAKLAPAITICLLDKPLFPDTGQAHHRFEMVDRSSGRKLYKAIEVHTVELKKYDLSEGTIPTATKLTRWAFFLSQAQRYESARLKQLLPGIEFDQAIETISRISAITEDREMYNQREKAQRDYEWALAGAREEGRDEGKLAGKIQMLQELLGDPVSTDADLVKQASESLQSTLALLQQRLRERSV